MAQNHTQHGNQALYTSQNQESDHSEDQGQNSMLLTTIPNPQDGMLCNPESPPQKLTPQETNQHQSEKERAVNKNSVLQLQNYEMDQLREQLVLNGLPVTNATLEVKVTPDLEAQALKNESPSAQTRKLQLDKSDLQNVFQAYGIISDIVVQDQGCSAFVVFEDVIDAFIAKMRLDKMKLPRDDATLHVKFHIPKEGSAADQARPEEGKQDSTVLPDPLKQLNKNQPFQQPVLQLPQFAPNQQISQFNTASPFSVEKQQTMSNCSSSNFNPAGFGTTNQQFACNMNQSAPSFNPGKFQLQQFNSSAPVNDTKMTDSDKQDIKYTCRYDIQIDNEKEFQVARRVIGSKGSNMKRIIEECSRDFDTKVNPYEVVKLRLRGKGSGFKEGQNQEESEDPLNLCISSKYKDKFDYACNEMEKLLLKVYDEFYYFYLYKHRKPALWGKKLEVIKEDSITQPKVFEEYEAQSFDAKTFNLNNQSADKALQLQTQQVFQNFQQAALTNNMYNMQNQAYVNASPLFANQQYNNFGPFNPLNQQPFGEFNPSFFQGGFQNQDQSNN